MNYGINEIVSAAVETARRWGGENPLLQKFAHSEIAQPLWEHLGRFRAERVYHKARAECPAYREFIVESIAKLSDGECVSWDKSPMTTKENYVKRWGVEARCYGGKIPARGVVIDESSGSSGTPNNWVRSQAERDATKRLLQISYRQAFGEENRIFLNCFALGPWATGMTVSQGLADVGILKSLGPEQGKLENTLRTFGASYRYLIFGYPPFLKQFMDTTTLPLSDFHLDLVVGGEGMSEALRGRLREVFKTVRSSYGASDLQINLGMETPLTIRLRGLCQHDAALCDALFGRENPPMIFQYDPLECHIEPLPGGELAFTLTNRNAAAPKIRYNLRDRGGVLTFREVKARLAAWGIAVSEWPEWESAFPILYIFGRADSTISFYGAKLYPSDIEQIIAEDADLHGAINTFQIESVEDAALRRTLIFHLEETPNRAGDPLDPAAVRDALFDGLRRVNQDFREVTKMFDRSALEAKLHPYASGPFAGRDRRIKNAYTV